MDGLFLTSCRHWWGRVNNTVIEFHLSITSALCRAQTRIAHSIDSDAKDCATSPPIPIELHLSVTSRSRGARTWIAGLVDRDANDVLFPCPPHAILHHSSTVIY